MDIKVIEALSVLTAMKKFLDDRSLTEDAVSLVLCGDFNSMEVHQPEFCRKKDTGETVGGVYGLIHTGKLAATHPEHPACFRHPCTLRDLVSPLHPMTPADHFPSTLTQPHMATTKTADFSGRIDYIWIGQGINVSHVLELPFTAETFAAFPPIPGPVWPSDHLAIGAIFNAASNFA